MDNSIFYLINKSCRNGFFDLVMPWLTKLGDWKVLLCIAVILVFFRKKEVRRFGYLLLTGLIVSIGVVYILKGWTAKPRPFMLLQNVDLLTEDKGFSFPSGHATNIFMAIGLLCVYFKRFYYGYILAFAVAFSRVYLGVHFPSDVAAGALIGSIIGYGVTAIGRLKNAAYEKH